MATQQTSDFPTTPTTYPAKTRTSNATIANTHTVCTRIDFADRILLTISQEGRLAYWLQTPLTPPTPTPFPDTPSTHLSTESHLPPIHLTPTALLGTPPSHLATFAQLLAAKIGGLMLEASSNNESRPLVLGVGLAAEMLGELKRADRQAGLFEELVGLVMGVL